MWIQKNMLEGVCDKNLMNSFKALLKAEVN